MRQRRQQSIYIERAELVDAQFLGNLSPADMARLAEIDLELERRDAPRVAKAREDQQARLGAIDIELAALESEIMMRKNAARRPQTKTAGSH